MVRLQDLSIAPVEEKKKYIFQMAKQGGPKKEWHLERERRKNRAQKKEQRRKNMDEQKEVEKNKWKNFSAKANAKNMKVHSTKKVVIPLKFLGLKTSSIGNGCPRWKLIPWTWFTRCFFTS
jgi:hypothetical protein